MNKYACLSRIIFDKDDVRAPLKEYYGEYEASTPEAARELFCEDFSLFPEDVERVWEIEDE